ncbi:MAG: hypothetical protein ACXAB7_14385 [Candidatus Kariarchaeaceae archaeon]|jgi:hypothetical protein
MSLTSPYYNKIPQNFRVGYKVVHKRDGLLMLKFALKTIAMKLDMQYNLEDDYFYFSSSSPTISLEEIQIKQNRAMNMFDLLMRGKDHLVTITFD